MASSGITYISVWPGVQPLSAVAAVRDEKRRAPVSKRRTESRNVSVIDLESPIVGGLEPPYPIVDHMGL